MCIRWRGFQVKLHVYMGDVYFFFTVNTEQLHSNLYILVYGVTPDINVDTMTRGIRSSNMRVRSFDYID